MLSSARRSSALSGDRLAGLDKKIEAQFLKLRTKTRQGPSLLQSGQNAEKGHSNIPAAAMAATAGPSASAASIGAARLVGSCTKLFTSGVANFVRMVSDNGANKEGKN